ncbi:MAG: serine/threonine protein phosphatase [Anaerolineaceae bacterium]|nr:MAG: serine/threonine protein phosphatase [Anaerolineaceae bacterium]
MEVNKRLSQVMSSSLRIPLDDYSRYIIMSDCHRGDGGFSDNFSNNQNIFFAALQYYYERGFTYIELGDGDELWEGRKIDIIINTHSDAFWLMSQFYREGRFHMIYGNHDIVKRDPKYSKTKCKSFFCDSTNSDIPLFPNIKITEGLILDYRNPPYQIFLTHGHQADILNDTFWRLSRFLVRYLWRPLELIGIRDPTSASKNSERKSKVELRLAGWSAKKNQMIITGHTHRPVFPKPGETLYFNDGSCVHPRCITGIEIMNGSLSLIKWAIMTRHDRSLYVGREVLEGPIRIDEYIEKTLKTAV